MAWTTLTDIIDGGAMTAANLNAWIFNNLRFLKGVGGSVVALDGPLTLPAGAALAIGTVLWALRTSKGANWHVEKGEVTATIQDNGGNPNNTALPQQTFGQLFASAPTVILSVYHNQAFSYSVGARQLGASGNNAFNLEAWTNKANTIVTVSWIAIGPSLAGL